MLGIRTGYEDEEARARAERKPAHLSEAAGVFYDEFASIDTPLAVRGTDGFELPDDATATSWVDSLQVLDADVLARYDHPHFGRWPAVTTRAHGSGRVTTVGTIPDPALARAVLAWAVAQGGPAAASSGPAGPGWRPQGPSQTVSGATNPAGERVRFVHSWSWEPSTFVLPGAVRDLLSGEELAAGAELTLGPWDVRVLLEV